MGVADGLFGEPNRVRRETSNPASQSIDEGTDFLSGQGPIEVAPSLGCGGIKIFAAQDDFQGSAPSDQVREGLSAAPARQDSGQVPGSRQA